MKEEKKIIFVDPEASDLLEQISKFEDIDDYIKALVYEELLDNDHTGGKTDPEEFLRKYLHPTFTWLGENICCEKHDGAEIPYIFQIGSRYFRADGFYSSWGDSEYPTSICSFYEVKKTERVVFDYKPI